MKNLSIFKREYTDGIKRRETREGSYVATLVLVHFFFTVQFVLMVSGTFSIYTVNVKHRM